MARDLLNHREARHELAKELFARAQRREVELAVAPQGQRLDADGDLGAQLRAMLDAEGVADAPQLAYPSRVTLPAGDLIPGAHVLGFADAWDQVVATWQRKGRPPATGSPPKDADRFHVETHVLHGRDVFITDDGPLLTMCRRLRDEHGITVEGMPLADYLAR